MRRRNSFLSSLNAELCTYVVVNNGVTYETVFRTGQRVEQVINKMKDNHIAKGKQGSTSGGGKQSGRFKSKFKAKNIK